MKLVRLRWIVVLSLVQCITLGAEIHCYAQVNEQAAEDAGAEIELAKKTAPEFLKPMINVELSLVKRVCEPSDAQMKAIVAAVKDAHEAMADIVKETGELDDDDNQGQHSEIKFVGPDGEWVLANPHKRIREDMARLLKQIVSQQQYARYMEETKAREEYERETAIGILIGLLDSKLALSAEQRDRLQRTFQNDLKEVDIHWLASFDASATSLPPLPDQLFAPELDEAQQKILASLPRDHMYAGIYNDGLVEFAEEWLK